MSVGHVRSIFVFHGISYFVLVSAAAATVDDCMLNKKRKRGYSVLLVFNSMSSCLNERRIFALDELMYDDDRSARARRCYLEMCQRSRIC